jgi:predicted DNA-binding transcriptional regulator AlpA
MKPNRPLTTAEVSAWLGVPPETLRYWRHRDKGPRCYRLGGKRVVYDPADVDQWLADQKAATARGGAM